jgi:hypothetical protein
MRRRKKEEKIRKRKIRKRSLLFFFISGGGGCDNDKRMDKILPCGLSYRTDVPSYLISTVHATRPTFLKLARKLSRFTTS